MADAGKKSTPMMDRYREVKAEHPDAILLFRMGDFYELFFEDARIVAKALGLTLTSRDKNSAEPVPMAGFPYHALDGQLRKLIQAGFRVAICDQVEDPKSAKGMVRREVTRVVTPGTLTDDSLLDPAQHNFIASLCLGDDRHVGLAWLEISTGEFQVSLVPLPALRDELIRLAPAELLLPDDFPPLEWPQVPWSESRRMAWEFGLQTAHEALRQHLGVLTLEGFGVDDSAAYIRAAGALIRYAAQTQRTTLTHLDGLRLHESQHQLQIDEASRRSLELTQTFRDGQRKGSLIDVLDRTVTPMGARLLHDWLAGPSCDLVTITQRQDAIEEFTRAAKLLANVREELTSAYDLFRLTSRVATGRASPRDLSALARTLGLLPKLKAQLAGCGARRLGQLDAAINLEPALRERLDAMLVEEPPLTTSEGGIIRAGVSSELDELRTLARGGRQWIAEYQAAEIQRTGISNLKVGFNKVFGFYLEVTAAHQAKVPTDYVRKQTLKNQERYITPALKEYEDKVLRADEKAMALEQQLFGELRDFVATAATSLRGTAGALAELDVLAGLAHLALHRGYCRPEVTDLPVLDLREGRHPVLDATLPAGKFVPNDIRLGGDHGRVQIITGPNMAGKSTYIRQAALLTVMAQMGSFVPASEARIGIADRIFARVGASDELGRGHSTFMVEMTETARILHTATPQSLVILDEIGRGTSTYDGISLAWAVTEYLHDITQARTLFATHYHELTEATQTLPQARNWNVAVLEENDTVVFLHRIVEGSADRSYGIHVARLAGIPAAVIDRADELLTTLESHHVDREGKPKMPARRTHVRQRQLRLFAIEEHPVVDQLRQLNVDHMTPLEALNALHTLRTAVKKP